MTALVAAHLPECDDEDVVRITKNASWADLEALPPGWKGDLIDGVLYAQPRPAAEHQGAIGVLHHDVGGPFGRGGGGAPGGWWILVEPGIRIAPRAPEFAPDLAGWRRERMPGAPRGAITLVPDWICEVLSPSTRNFDLVVKRRFYASIGVGFLWYVDLDARALTASQLVEGRWVELGVYGDEGEARIAPFDAIAFSVRSLWTAPPRVDERP